MSKRKKEEPIYYMGEMEKQSRLLLDQTKKTMEDMESYYPTLLKDRSIEEVEKEVEGRKASLKRAKKNVLKAYELLSEITMSVEVDWQE